MITEKLRPIAHFASILLPIIRIEKSNLIGASVEIPAIPGLPNILTVTTHAIKNPQSFFPYLHCEVKMNRVRNRRGFHKTTHVCGLLLML